MVEQVQSEVVQPDDKSGDKMDVDDLLRGWMAWWMTMVVSIDGWKMTRITLHHSHVEIFPLQGA